MNIILYRGKLDFTEVLQPDAANYPVGTIGYFDTRKVIGSSLRIIKRSSRMKHYWTDYYGVIPLKVKTALLLLGE
jgi:hypothetical protein